MPAAEALFTLSFGASRAHMLVPVVVLTRGTKRALGRVRPPVMLLGWFRGAGYSELRLDP